MIQTFRISFAFLAMMTLLLGLAYPSAVWLAGRIFFPHEADGSLLYRSGDIVGSALIGQSFTGQHYFWSRPSETPSFPYNATASGASNLNPTNPKLLEKVRNRVDFLRKSHDDPSAVTIDLVTASGSGLDPHISPMAAFYQATRLAKARGLPLEEVKKLIAAHVEPRAFGILGEPRVNVLRLNLMLDRLCKERSGS